MKAKYGERLILAGLLDTDVAADSAGVEDGPADGEGAGAPGSAVGVEELSEGVALEPEVSAEGEAGVQVGGGDADAGDRRGDAALLQADVGSAAEELGREADGDLGGGGGERLGGGEERGERSGLEAEEDVEPEGGLLERGFGGDLGAGGLGCERAGRLRAQESARRRSREGSSVSCWMRRFFVAMSSRCWKERYST